MKRYPVTRQGWAEHYGKLYDQTGRETAAHLAVYYLLLKEAFGERPSAEPIKKQKKRMGDFYLGRA